MLARYPHVFQPCSSNVLFASTCGAQRRGISQAIHNVTRLCKTKINSRTWEFRPFLRQCTRQVDYVAAQKLKRGQQWIRFYSQLWSSDRFTSLLIQMGRRLGIAIRHRKFSTLIFAGAALVPADSKVQLASDAEENLNYKNNTEIQTPRSQVKRASLIEDTISDEKIASHTKDLLLIEQLKETTLTCGECQNRHVIDQMVDGVCYCTCENKLSSVYGVSAKSNSDESDSSEGWLPFLERKDILVWRREHADNPGLFAYKMYGKFDDVSAKEFLEVQMDVSAFRMSWDISTAQCHVLLEEKGQTSAYDDTDTARQATTDTNQIYFWEVNWPRFFSNRDYVCARRACIFENDKEKSIVVYTRSTTHPSCPEKPKNYRVTDYWSVMVIKPFNNLGDVGIEFSLTAFENPGLSLPSSITTWVAIRGMPEFMENLRTACFQKRKWTENEEKHKPTTGNSNASKLGLKSSKEEHSYMETPVQYSSQKASEYSNAYV